MDIGKIIKRSFFGKKTFQRFFRRLFDISIEGMNIGVGGRKIVDSGELFAIKYCLKNETNPIVFDVGAQGGEYTEMALKISDHKARIYAFEPCLKDYRELADMFRNQSVVSVNRALGENHGRSTLYFPKDKSGLSTLIKSDGNDSTEEVEVDTIDDFCSKNKISSISLLKLDTEGYELSCLKGARKMLPNIKYIQFEMSIGSRQAKTYFKDIFDFLKDYRIYRILQDGLVEIATPDRLSELLFTTNYLAIRKDLLKLE